MEILTYVAVLVLSRFVSAALAPKPSKPKPASLADIDAPTAQEGRPIAVVFGTVTVKGPNLVWYGNLRTKAIKSKGGKK